MAVTTNTFHSPYRPTEVLPFQFDNKQSTSSLPEVALRREFLNLVHTVGRFDAQLHNMKANSIVIIEHSKGSKQLRRAWSELAPLGLKVPETAQLDC